MSEALTCHMFYVRLCYIMQAYLYHKWRVLAKDIDDLALEKAWLSSISYFLLNYAPFEIVFSILRCAMENILFQTLLFNKK